MKIWHKNIGLFFLVSVITFSAVSVRVEAFSFGLNPLTVLSQLVNTIESRASDIIYYLVMQKKYIFNNYQDPNIYPTLTTPANVQKIIASSTVSASHTVYSTGLVSVTTSTLPVPSAPKSASGGQTANPDSQAILSLTNVERSAVGLSTLSDNSVLDTIAGLRADDMFANQYFAHESPDGRAATDLAKKYGYSYILIGENIALGNFGGNQGIMTAWMHSLEHKANILNGKYEELGAVVKAGIYNGQATTIAVQVFGKPLGDCPLPKADTKALIDSTNLSLGQMRTQAMAMYNNLVSLKNNPATDSSYYNQKTQEYNTYAKTVNDAVLALKGIVDAYNLSVSRYNTCVGL